MKFYDTPYTYHTHMILKKCPSESPHAGEHKIDLIEFTGRVSGSVLVH